MSLVPKIIPLKLFLDYSRLHNSHEGLRSSQSCDVNFTQMEIPRGQSNLHSPANHLPNARGYTIRGKTGYHNYI